MKGAGTELRQEHWRAPARSSVAGHGRAALLCRRAELLEAAARVDRELAALEGSDDCRGYTSIELPPHTTRRAFRQWCAAGHVEGAVKDGQTWICGREQWHASKRRNTRSAVEVIATVATDDGAAIDEALADAGFRPTVTERDAMLAGGR